MKTLHMGTLEFFSFLIFCRANTVPKWADNFKQLHHRPSQHRRRRPRPLLPDGPSWLLSEKRSPGASGSWRRLVLRRGRKYTHKDQPGSWGGAWQLVREPWDEHHAAEPVIGRGDFPGSWGGAVHVRHPQRGWIELDLVCRTLQYLTRWVWHINNDICYVFSQTVFHECLTLGILYTVKSSFPAG